MIFVLVTIVELIVIFLVLRFIYSFIKTVLIRISFINNLKQTCKQYNFVLKLNRSPLMSVFGISSKPDFTVKTRSKMYQVRFITCLYRKKAYHFVTPEHCITYFDSIFDIPFAKITSDEKHFAQYHHYKKLKIDDSDKNTENILLFNPKPAMISSIDDNGKLMFGKDLAIGEYVAYATKGATYGCFL